MANLSLPDFVRQNEADGKLFALEAQKPWKNQLSQQCSNDTRDGFFMNT